jgi:hypothetical protein
VRQYSKNNESKKTGDLVQVEEKTALFFHYTGLKFKPQYHKKRKKRKKKRNI